MIGRMWQAAAALAHSPLVWALGLAGVLCMAGALIVDHAQRRG